MLSYVAQSLSGQSGSAQSALDVLIALLASQYRIVVYTRASCPIPSISGSDTFYEPIWCLSIKSAPFPRRLSSNLPEQLTAWFSKIREIARRRHFNALSRLVLVNSLANHDYFSAIKPRFRGKKVLVVRESPFHYNGPWRLKPFDWAINAMKDYDKYIFVSSRCRDSWIELMQISKEDTYYIPNCSREDLIDEIKERDPKITREQLGLPEDKFVLACVGSIQYRKGQDLLVNVCDELFTLIPNLFICLIGPAVGEWGETLCAHIRSTYPETRFKCFGGQLNALEYIHASDLLVLPSRAEAMPRVILEAMTLKRPVLASDVDGIPELIEDNVTGLLFNHDHPERLLNGIVQIAKDRHKGMELSAKACDKYWSRFSRSHQIERFNKVIRSLIED
jgi:glycosyltransferase involved in cell wall biosynthesis